jgi:hypothetical protein
MADIVEGEALVAEPTIELTAAEQYAELVARAEFLCNHKVIEVSKLNVNSCFKIGGLAPEIEYIMIKKGTKYVYFRESDDPFPRLQDLYKRRLDYEVYIPK